MHWIVAAVIKCLIIGTVMVEIMVYYQLVAIHTSIEVEILQVPAL